MGVVLSYSRLIEQIRQISDLESQLQRIADDRKVMMNQITAVTDVGDLTNTDSAAVKELSALKERLKILDRELDIKQEVIKNRLQAVQADRDSTEAMLQSNIQTSFSYGRQRMQ